MFEILAQYMYELPSNGDMDDYALIDISVWEILKD